MVDNVRTLAIKKEAVYATDAAPTLAANAVPTRDFEAQPIQVDQLDRQLDTGTWGAQPGAATNARQTLSFKVEAAGSGAAGTAPRWMELLQGCGMAPPVIVAATEATQRFALSTEAQSALTVHHWKSDQRRRGVGARGTWGIDFTANAYPYFMIELTALLATTAFDVSAPGVADYTPWKPPLEVGTANTSILIDGYAPALRSFKLNAEVQTNVRSLVGARYINRGPHAMTGRMLIEAPSLTTKDYITPLRTGALLPVSVTHGTVAGNIVGLTIPRLQIREINETEEDGKLMWDVGIAATVSAPGDEISLFAR